MRIVHKWRQPLAVLDAGIARNVTGTVPGWCRYERKEQTQGSVGYSLFHRDLSDIGSIELQMMAHNLTDMHIVPPGNPDEHDVLRQQRGDMQAEFNERGRVFALLTDNVPTPLAAALVFETLPLTSVIKANDGWRVMLPDDERRTALSTARKQLRQAIAVFTQRRVEHHQAVIELLINRLASDGITLEGAVSPSTEKREGGPTAKTELLFQTFEEIKQTYPDYTYEQVADAYNQQHPSVNNMATENTVRNTYRLMKKSWRSGKRRR